jgi:hypothetical protein
MTLAPWAQSTAWAQRNGPAVGFRNELKVSVVVQGYTVVNGMAKRGQLILIAPGKIGVENNVPAGAPRYYTVYDLKNNQVYLANIAVPVQNDDLALAIRNPAPNVFKLDPAR